MSGKIYAGFTVFLIGLVFLAGCASVSSINPNAIYEIQKFLSDNPNLSFSVTLQSKEQVAADESFSQYCQGIEAKEYYKITIIDADGALNGNAWVNPIGQKLVCFFKKAVNSTAGDVSIQKIGSNSNVPQNPLISSANKLLLVRFVLLPVNSNSKESVIVSVYYAETKILVEEKETDSDGIADFYLKNGTYFFTASNGINVKENIASGEFKVAGENQKILIKLNQNEICPQIMPPAPGWCNDGKIEKGEINENGCQKPPKCVLPICPADVKQCADGSYVKRNPEKKCEFDKCSDDISISQPYCDAIGTKSEGWYSKGEDWVDKGGLIMWANCKGCTAQCKNVETKSEGWFSSCTGERITFAKCGIEHISIEEAIVIAKNSECIETGNLTEKYSYNEFTKTWWIDLDASKPGCNPACVVKEETKTAEVNWRCTGAIEPICQNSPPPDFCIEGKAISSEKDESGCPIWKCVIQVCAQDVQKCPDGNYVSRDPNNNCEFKPCPIKACAEEGENFSIVYKEDYPQKCCDGLTEWESGMDSRKVENGKCVETGLLKGSPIGTCLKCGNQICGLNENICNCPQDCNSITVQ